MMKRIPKKLLVAGILCCMIIAVSGVWAFAFTDGIQLTLPEDSQRINQECPPPVVPTLIPPEEPSWEQCEPSQIKQENPIAYLTEEYEKRANHTMVSFMNADSASEQAVAYRIVSAVKYELADGSTIVTLSEASPAASKANAVYGFATVTLSNGEKAFLKDGLKGTYPRSLVMVRNSNVITIATTESKEELIKMAENLILMGK